MGSTSENTEKGHVIGEVAAEERLPVISINASNLDLGTVARTLLRAHEYEFIPLVLLPESDGSRIKPLAEKLDAIVFEFDFSDGDPSIETVEQFTKAFDFPAVLYYDTPDSRIDFSRCAEVIEKTDSYSTEAPLMDDLTAEKDETFAAIPAYNEESTIESVVNGVQRHVDDVLVIDDGSTDDTVANAERAGATVIEHETNRGYGAALKTLFSQADERDADVLVTLDGDGQHDPNDVPKLVETIRETDANVVVGSRFHSDADHNVPLYRRVGLFVINVLTNLSLGISPLRSWVSDTQSGLRAFDGQAIASLAADDMLSDNMSASTDILFHARRKGYDVEEVGTTIYYDEEETSTQNPFFHGLSIVSNILRTIERERPLTFIGLPGITAVLLGVGLGYWAVLNYVQTGTFPTGLVLFCIFSTFLGTLLAFAGVILHSIKTHFEPLTDGALQG